jgi:hypothetical protein
VRIVLRGDDRSCSVPGCDCVADVCKKHVVEAVIDERSTGMARAIEVVAGMIAAFKITEKRGDADDFIEGRVEGLQSALSVMVKGTRTKL